MLRKYRIHKDKEKIKIKKRILFLIFAVIPLLMFMILIYETQRLESDLYRIVGMRARAMQDYLHRVSNQSRALGLSVTDYMVYHEDSAPNSHILKKMKDFPTLNRFGISINKDSENDAAYAGTLTAVGSIHKVNSSLIREIEAVLSLGGQFETLAEKQTEVVWVYYLSAQQFLYFTPKVGKAEHFHFTDELYVRPFWVQAEPKANPEKRQIITELYDDINGKGLMITIAEPVYYHDKFIGVASIDISLDTMKQILETGDVIGESMLIDEHRHVIAKTGKDDLQDLQKIQIPEIPSEILSRKDHTYWASFEVKVGDVYLVHRIEVIDFILYILKSLLPIWGLVCALAVVLVLYLQLRSSIEQISTLIHTDPLTGISNRRGFLKLAQKSLAISSRHGQTWTILMVDIDHFKSVNDQYGHDEGDKILVRVAQILSSCVRQTDAVCRWGGEEFAVFLFGANPEDSINIAEHLRKEVENKVVLQNGNSVTLSIGISEGRGGKHGLEESFSHADQALYRAKSTGRNRVCVFDPIHSF
ncbi:diguanylate cyclase [Leptospira tipperaryensis]|uniref:diguanylate cyclase n=1 Tax=Leptospira tipperaryensis TaxID=2564040 RepID=A0A1D7V3C9_9LEPT|nr:sensor domain-containing diguanylate cyclase [Leptospira tipperaryensis]AOP36341.1 diguanylate cyclase [Leptospira tipperaryensis]